MNIIYDEEDFQTAAVLQSVCKRTAEILNTKWNLQIPFGTQVHIMRSWIRFPFRASSWFHKILLVLTFPVWAVRAKKLWAFTGGWTLPYLRRPAIGIKPPDILQESDRSLGRRIFIEGTDDSAKIEMITCHELTHASTAFLKLPAWLNEGVAMVAVDAYFGYDTVKFETLYSLKTTQPKVQPRDYRQLHRADNDTLIYLYVRGYWITRFFSKMYPETLSELLSERHSQKVLLEKLSHALQLPTSEFWHRIDDIVVEYHDQSKDKE